MNNSKIQKRSIIFLTIAYLIPFIIQVAFLVFQVSKGIVSIWNMVTIVMMIFLYGFAFKRVRLANTNAEERIEKRKEDFEVVKQDWKKKMAVKSRLILVLVAVIAAAGSVFLYKLYTSKTEGLTLVNSKVVDQWGETTVVVEETDEGIQETESDYIEVTVEYEYKGEIKGAVIKATTTDKIYVDELKIFIDEEGKFVADYGRIAVWNFEAIVLFSFACIMLICAIFGLGTEFVGGSAFVAIGTALMFVISSPLFENFLYNDLTCFTLLFANAGLCLIFYGVLCLIFGKLAVYGLYNTKMAYNPMRDGKNEEQYNNQMTSAEQHNHEEYYDSTTGGENYNQDEYHNGEVVEEYHSQETHSHDIIELCCDNCGEPIGATDKFCGNCGKKLNDN